MNSKGVKRLVSLATGVAAMGLMAFVSLGPAQAGAGYQYGSDVVAAQDYNVYAVTFTGGEEADVMAAGNGDIDLYIVNQDGDVVAYDNSEDSFAEATWEPEETGTYYVVVANAEDFAVNFDIETN